MKQFLKNVYMRVFRLPTILKFKKFGKNSFVGSHACVKNGKHISIEDNVRIGNFCRLACYPEYAGEKLNPEIDIDSGCYIGDYFTVLSGSPVKLEKDVLIASNVLISSENHGIDAASDIPYKSQALIVKPVVIGEGTWIGQNVVIMSGVTIGKGCVIGASAVVTKSMGDYCMAVGSPARIIKKFDFESAEWKSVNS